MLFQATLIAVITYLVACYAYGLYLLFKLYTGKRLHREPANLQENPRSLEDNTVAHAPSEDADPQAKPGYDTPAKAA
ncbi:MAG: hypothetical protein AAGJ38_08150 [Planctomycetota bacterium]